MVIVESEPVDDDQDDDQDADEAPAPVAPINVEAYQRGMKEIEAATEEVNADETAYLSAKEIASSRKKRLEASQSKLLSVIRVVSNRLREKPLFSAADHHTDQELLSLLEQASVSVTLEMVAAWTDAQKQEARAFALAAHSEQPRLMPPFLFPPGADETAESAAVDAPGILEGESAVAYAKRRQAELAIEQAVEASVVVQDEEPAAEGHHYPKRVRKPRTRRQTPVVDDPSEPGDDA